MHHILWERLFHWRRPHRILLYERHHMNPITSLSIVLGQPAVHVTAVVLDQFGQPMPGAVPTVSDSAQNTTFTPDAGTTAAGNVAGTKAGADVLTLTFGGITATVPVTVTQPASVPTSIILTSP